jgi:acyl-CoA thioesterase-1
VLLWNSQDSRFGGKVVAMTDWTTLVVGQFISGRAFFYGIALCWLGCLLKLLFKRTWVHSLARMTLLTSVVLVVLSAAPFPFWIYGVFFALLAWAVFRLGQARGEARKPDYHLPLLLLLAHTFLMVAMEIRFVMAPKISLAGRDTLFVVGDSISMGADPPGKNWPQLLGDLAKLKVRSFSFGGAKVETALDNARRINQDDALVILEIGGNDLLSGTSIPKFQAGLEKMMALACGPHRSVVMIELPLPPFYNRYGMVQRAVAREHGVTLVPKRFIADVMSTPGATVDGLHFSNAGHVLFAQAVFGMFTHSR